MKQHLLEELDAPRNAHRTAKTPDDFDALELRLQMIEALSVKHAQHSRSERQSLARVRILVAESGREHRAGLKQPANFSGSVFTLMQAVRRGTTGYDI